MFDKKPNDIFDKLHKLPISRSGDRAPRMPLRLKLHLILLTTITPIDCDSINISRTGILICADSAICKTIEKGQIVLIKIDINQDYFQNEISTRAEIIRASLFEENGTSKTMIALKFCKYV